MKQKMQNIAKGVQKRFSFFRKPSTIKCLSMLGICFLATIVVVHAQTTDGIGTGIDTAGTTIKGLFSKVSTLIYAIAGVTGVVGGIRVYQKFQSEDQQAQKSLIQWVSAIVFLLIAGTVLKTVFGL